MNMLTRKKVHTFVIIKACYTFTPTAGSMLLIILLKMNFHGKFNSVINYCNFTWEGENMDNYTKGWRLECTKRSEILAKTAEM